MRNWKKAILVMLCLCLVLGTTACGARDNNNDNQVNDVTNGKDDMSDDSMLQDAGDAIGNGVEDLGNTIGDGVEDITDDMSGNRNDVNR